MQKVIKGINVVQDEDDKLEPVFVKGVELALEKKKLKGLPVVKCDKKTKKPYVKYPDGRVKYYG